MNSIPLSPRSSDAPYSLTPVDLRSPAADPSAQVAFGTGTPPQPQTASIAIISSGESPFDRTTLEALHSEPRSPFSVIYCNEIPGTTPVERGQALLAEIERRRLIGEFGPQTLMVVMLHGAISNNELILTDVNADVAIPAVVLLNALAKGTREGRDESQPAAPIVLSACHAESLDAHLPKLERALLINGSRERLIEEDASAVLQICIRESENHWRAGQVVKADQLFEELSMCSGDALHLIDEEEWVEHRLLDSSASLHAIDPRQAGLHVGAMLDHGSVDELAESLLLFGIAAYDSVSPGFPAMHRVLRSGDEDMQEKIRLLLAIGEDINAGDEYDDTLLHIVCNYGPDGMADEKARKDLIFRSVMARMLLENGADPDALNEDGESPFDIASATGEPALCHLFYEDAGLVVDPQRAIDSLRQAAERNDWDFVLSLLDDPRQATEADGNDPFLNDDNSSDAAMPDQSSAKSDS